MTRTLSLRRETLRELGAAELAEVAGAARTTECVATVVVGACELPTLECLTGSYTRDCTLP